MIGRADDRQKGGKAEPLKCRAVDRQKGGKAEPLYCRAVERQGRR